ncbi:hypothetical protein ACLMJK_003328 [Lecanora helva]
MVQSTIRSTTELDNLILLHASKRRAFITLWTASWCPSCKAVTPLIRDIIGKQGAGENRGGVGFAEVEFDAPTLGEAAGRYLVGYPHTIIVAILEEIHNGLQITGIPTLQSFCRGEAQLETRLTSVKEMKDGEFLKLWIEDEAIRGDSGGKGGGGGGGLFGGMFGLGGK